jgi:hypothetical protein
LAACGSDKHARQLLNTGDGGSGGSQGSGASGGGPSSAGAAGAGGNATAGASGAADTGSNAGSAGNAGNPGDEPPAEESCIPRQGCQRLCEVLGTDPACGLGNVTQCGCACEERFNGPCPEELDALLACTGEAPSIDCRVRGRIFADCENESFALEVCDFQAREQLCAGSYPDCTPYCRGAILSFCPLGPESVASCLCGCEASLVTTCASAFDAFMTCTTKAPVFDCDGAGHIVATTCANEWQELDACMAVGVEP